MTITPEMVRAIAANNTAAQLKTRIAELITDLAANPDRIVSVNTGGASYTREARLTLSDMLTLYQRALDMLEGHDDITDYAQEARPVFLR